MSIFLLKDPDCVFIHIPKTGGTSIRKGVWEKNYEGAVFGSVPKEWRQVFGIHFYDSVVVLEKRSIQRPFHTKVGTPVF
jgi:hypothetical protein